MPRQCHSPPCPKTHYIIFTAPYSTVPYSIFAVLLCSVMLCSTPLVYPKLSLLSCTIRFCQISNQFAAEYWLTTINCPLQKSRTRCIMNCTVQRRTFTSEKETRCIMKSTAQRRTFTSEKQNKMHIMKCTVQRRTFTSEQRAMSSEVSECGACLGSAG